MQPLKFVIGFVPTVDKLPRDLMKMGLARRFAFVLETYRADSVDEVFDVGLYEGILKLVLKIVQASTIRVVISRRENRDVSAFEDLHELLLAVPEAKREPFGRCYFVRGSSVVAAMESEPWAHVGGPEPYHDSYTLAVFTKLDLSEIAL